MGFLSAQAWGWVGFAALLLCAPAIFPSDFALSLLSQMGIAIVACLSYNVLLGQGGMLSFGHSVYTGLAAFICVHVLNRIAQDAGVSPPPRLSARRARTRSTTMWRITRAA